MPLARWLVAESKHAPWHWLEALLVPLLAAELAYLAQPGDPFLLEVQFPWLLLVPVLIALRYGALLGVFSIAVLCAVWLGESAAGIVTREVPALHLTGAVLLALICGEFSSVWEARRTRAEGALAYLRAKLERLTRQHYLLLSSHRRLEHEQLSRPVTLRAALGRIRRLARNPADASGLPGADALATLLAQVCQLEAASLHDCRQGAPQPLPAALIGTVEPLQADDPMVRASLRERALVHLQTRAPAFDDSRYLVVAPAVSSNGALLALLAVQRMPFLALHDEMLSMLAVLLGYYADALETSRAARVMQRALAQCPMEFADELIRMHRMRVQHDVPSALLLLRFGGHPDSAAFAGFVRRQVRDLDLIWDLPAPRDAEGSFDMLLLLPLAGEAGAAEAVQRLEHALDARYGLGFDAARVRPYTALLESGDPFVSLKLFLDLHDVRL